MEVAFLIGFGCGAALTAVLLIGGLAYVIGSGVQRAKRW